MTLTIKTNNVPRIIIGAWELTDKEKKEFDYLDWEAIESGNNSAYFFRYKGEVYDLSQFMCARNACGFAEWDGYFSDSAFSGILVKYCKEYDNDMLVVATYYS